MKTLSEDTSHNSEVIPSSVSELPANVEDLLEWYNVEVQRDLEIIRAAVRAHQTSVAELDEAFSSRIAFWEDAVDSAPHRRVSPRSRVFAPTGVIAALARARKELLEEFRSDLPDFEAEVDFGRLSEIE